MDNLSSKTVKELLIIAKEYQIVGRHDMKKQQLIDAIVKVAAEVAEIEKDTEKALGETDASAVNKTHDDYIKNLKPGDIIAFQFYSPFGKKITRSAKVIDPHSGEVGLTVQDKIGNKHFVYRSKILWVKTGKRWPKYIYSMFKGETANG